MVWYDDYPKGILWQYNGSDNPWSENPLDAIWVEYDDMTNEMIEEAFQEKKTKVSIDAYYIDLLPDRMIQVSKVDKSRQRPVRRLQLGTTEPPIARQARFTEREKPAARSIANSSVCMSPFVNEWIRRNPNYKFRDDTIEKLATGLLQEGQLLGKSDSANFLASRLRKNKGAPQDEIAKFCVKMYTKETWVYKLVNTALREEDMNKIDTLGPFCCFVRNYLYESQKSVSEDTVVYRSMQLTNDDIKQYKKSEGEVKSWLAFSSTTRSREKAEDFPGNTLFIIQFDNDLSQRYPGSDISRLSQYPQEEEVLLYPGADFRIDKVEENIEPGKRTVIYLSLL